MAVTRGLGAEGIGEVLFKVQSTSSRQINPRDLMYSIMRIDNNNVL